MTDKAIWKVAAIAMVLGLMTLGAWVAGKPETETTAAITDGLTPGLRGSTTTIESDPGSTRSTTTSGSTSATRPGSPTTGAATDAGTDPTSVAGEPTSPPFTMAAPVTIAGTPTTTYHPEDHSPGATSPNRGPTTTLPPTKPSAIYLAPTSSITNTCDLLDSLATLELIFLDPSSSDYPTLFGSALDRPTIIAQLAANLTRYAEVASTDIAPDVLAIRTMVMVLVDQLRSNGYDTSDPDVLKNLDALRNGSPPFGAFAGHSNRVQDYNRRTCTR